MTQMFLRIPEVRNVASYYFEFTLFILYGDASLYSDTNVITPTILVSDYFQHEHRGDNMKFYDHFSLLEKKIHVRKHALLQILNEPQRKIISCSYQKRQYRFCAYFMKNNERVLKVYSVDDKNVVCTLMSAGLSNYVKIQWIKFKEHF